MKKLYASILLVLTTVIFSSYATKFDKNPTIILEWLKQGDLKEEEAVFAKSFAVAYNILPEDTDRFLISAQEAFKQEVLDFNNPSKKIYCVNAKKDGTVVGFMTFENTQKQHEVYIRQMAVDPSMWGKGIGTTLMSSIFDKLPDTQRIVLVTRKVNTGAQAFYKKLGFKASEYTHEGLSPERYMGFEYNI